MGRTAITVAKTHKGAWQLIATPDDNLIAQKKNFHALRASKAHPEFSTVIYQESDGHALINRLLTPAAAQAIDDRNAQDHAAAAAFDKVQAAVKEKNPDRAKAAAEFKKNEVVAAALEAYAKEKDIKIHEIPAAIVAEITATATESPEEEADETGGGETDLEKELGQLSRTDLLKKVEDWNTAHADKPIQLGLLKGKKTIIAALLSAQNPTLPTTE